MIDTIQILFDLLPDLSPEIIGIVMIGAMLFAIFVGFPISFTLIFLGIFFGAWGFGLKLTIFLMNLQFYGSMICLLYTSPSPRDLSTSRMPSSA